MRLFWKNNIFFTICQGTEKAEVIMMNKFCEQNDKTTIFFKTLRFVTDVKANQIIDQHFFNDSYR